MSVDKVTHRGIRWQRDSQGRIRWWFEDQQRWVRWHPGDDAPPRPAGWETRGKGATPPLTRPGWRSPYRVIPLGLAVLILGVGLYQALSSHSATTSAAETAQATAFAGKCLPRASSAPNAGYSPKLVPCGSPLAAGKVVEVVTWDQGRGACPAHTIVAILTNTGVTHPHLECIQPLAGT